MDINEKVEQLLQITLSVKSDLNEMKSGELNAKLDDLEWEKEALKNDIIDLRNTLMRQNETILSLLRSQNEKLVKTIEADKLSPHLTFGKKVSNYGKMFPIKSMEDLQQMEDLINDNNINELVTVVQQLLTPQGLIKNLVSILSTECVIQCNVDGIQNKKRLLNYQKFMDLLYQAVIYDGYSQKAFLDDVRRGLKMIKNRHNKNSFRARQLMRMEQDQFEEDDEIELPQSEALDGLETLPEVFIKNEQILCD